MSLEVDIRKRYGDFRLDVRFEAEGRFALMGASAPLSACDGLGHNSQTAAGRTGDD